MIRTTTIIMLLFTCMMSGQSWKTNLEEVSNVAKKENKPILLVFSGSDWCAPCIKLEKRIWKSDAFKKYAENHLLLLKADFPRKKANQLSKEQQHHNRMLADKYNSNGYFPYILVLDKNGNKQAAVSFRGNDTPDDIIERIKEVLN